LVSILLSPRIQKRAATGNSKGKDLKMYNERQKYADIRNKLLLHPALRDEAISREQ